MSLYITRIIEPAAVHSDYGDLQVAHMPWRAPEMRGNFLDGPKTVGHLSTIHAPK